MANTQTLKGGITPFGPLEWAAVAFVIAVLTVVSISQFVA